MDYFEGVVTTIGHIAWPVTTTGIAILARKELRSIFTALATRIADKGSAVSITKEGLEIKAVFEAQQARLVTLQAEQEQVKSLALRQLAPVSAQDATPKAPDERRGVDSHLRMMADQYMKIDIPDYSERTRAKNNSAAEMAFYIVSNRIDKDALVMERHEGILVGFAESIILSAETGDCDRLLKAARGAERLHVRYRVLIAITKLLERNMIELLRLGDVQELLFEYEKNADNSLKRLIVNVRALVNEAVNRTG